MTLQTRPDPKLIRASIGLVWLNERLRKPPGSVRRAALDGSMPRGVVEVCPIAIFCEGGKRCSIC